MIPEWFLLDSGSKGKKRYTFFLYRLSTYNVPGHIFSVGYILTHFIAMVTLWGSCSSDSMDVKTEDQKV